MTVSKTTVELTPWPLKIKSTCVIMLTIIMRQTDYTYRRMSIACMCVMNQMKTQDGYINYCD